jgi:apolipoprotein N-acyltransferase
VLIGLLATLAYAADRLVAPRLHGVARTLVFPLALTAVDFAGSRLAAVLTPFLFPSLFSVGAVWDSPGYTQGPYLPLLQMVSLTGVWGLTFLMAWFGSTINALWEHRFRWQPVRIGTLAFSTTLIAVLVFGSVRLALFPPAQPNVRVAAIAPREAMVAKMNSSAQSINLMIGTPAERAKARALFAPIVADLLVRTERQASSGVKIITWGEGAGLVLEEDVPALIAQAAATARQHAVYLRVGLAVVRHTDHYPFMENRAILLDPTGAMAWDYHKTYPTPGENQNIAPGPGVIPTIDTPYGRLATAICYDTDYPELIRQAGQRGVDILLPGFNEWASIRVRHAQVTTFRAIENGFSIVRPAVSGISMVIDPHGRVVAQADAFGASEPTVVSLVAAAGTPTLYVRIGDWFAYLCVAGFLAVISRAFVQRRTTQPDAVPQPV